MARSTRGDSNKDTSSRQTSRGTSSDTKSARNSGASAAQTSNRGAQSRSAADLSGTTSRATQTAQSSTTTAQSNRAGQSNAEDRERSIETRDDGRGTEGRTAVGGVSPRQGSAPIFGGSGGGGGGGGGAFGGNPFAAMRRWSEDMDRLFQDFGFGQFGLGFSPRREIGELGRRLGLGDRVEWAPQVEAFRRGDNIVVRADLPGLKKEDVKVEVEDNMLTISGERNAEHEENRQGFYRSERSYGQFYRSIPLPEGVNADQCEATFKDGVLEVSLRAPQQRDKSAKQIPVR